MPDHYRREDGALMIKVSPGQYVNELAATRLGVRPASGKPKTQRKAGGSKAVAPKKRTRRSSTGG